MANSFAAGFPEIWSKKFLRNYDAASVVAALVNKDYQNDLATSGDKVHAATFGDVTVGTYTPGSDVAVQSVSLTDTEMDLDQFKAFNLVIDATEISRTHLPLVNGWTKRASVAMAQTVDTRLLGHYADVDSGNIIGSAAAPIALTKDNVHEYFVDARRILHEDNVMEMPVAVIDPDTHALLEKSEQLTHATQSGDGVIRNGFAGKFAGFKVVVSNRIATVSGVKNLMFFTKDFISLAVQIPIKGFETYKPEKQFGTGLKGLALYGSKVFQPTTGVVLKKAV